MGYHPHVLEVEKTRINLSVSKSPNAKTNISFSGHAAVGNGEGSSGTQLSINCEPVWILDCNYAISAAISIISHLKNIFWPNLCVGIVFQLLKIL